VRSNGQEVEERWTRVFDSDRVARFISGGASNRVMPGVGRFRFSLTTLKFQHSNFFAIRFTVLYYSTVIVILFDSVPTRFCLGTWQTLLSSPLLVMWKSNPIALGPHLVALLNVVSRVLSQVAQAHQ